MSELTGVPSAIGLARNAEGESVIKLQTFLQKFGYLKLIQNEVDVTARETGILLASKGTFDANTEIALQNYQKFYGLPQRGELDEDTVKHMALRRCGCRDNPQGLLASFTAQGNKWDKTSLTYRFVNFTADLSEAEVRNAIAAALGLWSAVTPLIFTEVTGDNNADILIRFATGDHGDGKPFDGVGNTLAHAFYPPPNGGDIAGDTHFDDDETWSVNLPPSGIDLVTVAAHEFGHSLGLDHSNVVGSLMNASYSGAQRFLHEDDIKGIQSIYGANRDPVSVDAPVSAVARMKDHLDLFVVGNDGRVYTSWWHEGSDWSGINNNWRSIGGFFPV
ncbi:matrixin family metalloprotease [Bacillus cereus]|uniref:matrixin family metalloprotease n=1 Tax=Bacillus cereus TaxID=1396 RepID=UPI000B4A71E0|nr:matrixin family metalloprotease [Bacillus cereus]